MLGGLAAGARFRVLGGVGRGARARQAAAVEVEVAEAVAVEAEQLVAGAAAAAIPATGAVGDVGLAMLSAGWPRLTLGPRPPLNVLIRLGGCESGEHTIGTRFRTIASPGPSA